MGHFHNIPDSLYSLFLKSLRHTNLLFFTIPAGEYLLLFAVFLSVNTDPSNSETICLCRGTYEDVVLLVAFNVGASELIIHFQEHIQDSFN